MKLRIIAERLQRAQRIALTALLVTLGCHLGATLDGSLRFPGIGTAIVFPPYAILAAALLLSPPRQWWIYLLAALAGDFLPHREAGAPSSFALLTEAANFTRALIVAVGLRRFGEPSGRLVTLRGMAVFLLVAVAIAPAVAALAGAAIVKLHGRTDGFWMVWLAWFLSNALTGLVLLPVLLLGIRGARALRRWPPPIPRPLRFVEAALLASGLYVVDAHVFLRVSEDAGNLPVQLYLPLPLLLWASVRFGPEGTSAALLGVSALTLRGAMHGRGPFVTASPAEDLMHLQFFLLAVSTPLLLLAALLGEQRDTAAALRESREQYRSVVEDQTEMIYRFRPDGTCTFANGAYCRFLVRTADEIVGRDVHGLFPPEVQRAARASFGALTAERPVATRETRVATADGEPRWQSWQDRGLFDERGRLVELQSVGRDITERKQSEERQRLLEAQRQVEAALREADQRKDEFLAVLGHELRNPLAPILMAADILRIPPVTDDTLAWAGDAIGRQAKHLARLVDDLLDLSRITRGTIALQPEALDLATIAAQAIETSRPLIDARKHTLSVHQPGASVSVQGDPVRLCQVVANLLNNAARYTPPGGRIDLTIERDGTLAVLRVEDNGIGIRQEMLERIFDLFVQAREPDGARERAAGGLGIGLTLVRRLVEMHGGTVAAHSRGRDQGTSLVVRLPATDARADGAPRAAPARGPGAAGARRRILIVDDNEDAAAVLAMLLEQQGHAVHVAHDGLAALATAETTEPDVVFLDINLPLLDGLEVARRLRARRGPGDLVLVATTGLGGEQDRRRIAGAGFDHHLVKPIEPAAIRPLLEPAAASRSA